MAGAGKRLQILLQEDIIAKYIDEYLVKVLVSVGIAVLLRVPYYAMDTSGLGYSLFLNLTVTLRVMHQQEQVN